MRTTVTLDADTLALVQKRMRERQISFKQAINEAIRDGAARDHRPRRYRTKSAALGVPRVNLDRAMRLAADLEDDELIRKMRSGK